MLLAVAFPLDVPVWPLRSASGMKLSNPIFLIEDPGLSRSTP